MWVLSLRWEDPLEQETVTHFSVLAWRIPWTDKPGGLQSIGSQESDRIENQATEQHLAHTFNTMNVPEFVTRGRNLSAHNWQPLNTPKWSRDPALHGARWPELDMTAGASSQGTNSEPRPPGLLLGVMMHVEPSTQNWRVKG